MGLLSQNSDRGQDLLYKPSLCMRNPIEQLSLSVCAIIKWRLKSFLRIDASDAFILELCPQSIPQNISGRNVYTFPKEIGLGEGSVPRHRITKVCSPCILSTTLINTSHAPEVQLMSSDAGQQHWSQVM